MPFDSSDPFGGTLREPTPEDEAELREFLGKEPAAEPQRGSAEAIDASVEKSPIAQSVAAALKNPANSGNRHSQMKSVVISLFEIGLSDAAVFTQFRGMYGADVKDSEIESIIAWAQKRLANNANPGGGTPTKAKIELTPDEANTRASHWLKRFECDEASLWHASEIRPEDDSPVSHDSLLVLTHLYRPSELVCINTRYLVEPKKDGVEKTVIVGAGETKTGAQWVEHIKAHGSPQNRAGAWIRLNPVSHAYGSGAGGAHTDADVSSFRYVLLESDLLERDVALSVYGKLMLPIAAIIDSAGRGPHAWVTVNCENAQQYAEKAKTIFDRLVTIGFDDGNKNPSRYSRLAGAQRIIGVHPGSDGFQKLLYLAPHLKPKGIFT
jgi:hypothetical protein